MSKKLTMRHADAVRALIAEYDRAEEDGSGSVEWETIDDVVRLAREAENETKLPLRDVLYGVLLDNSNRCLDNDDDRHAVVRALLEALA